MLVLAGVNISFPSSTTICGTHGSTSLRRREKSSTVSGTSKVSWKGKKEERSSSCGRMVEKSNFPVNAPVICNIWGFATNSIADIRRSKTTWLRGIIAQLWKRHGQCLKKRACPSFTGPKRYGPRSASRTASENVCA